MAETDVFERRLRAALVRHTDGGPNDFDAPGFARAVAAKEPRRHGLGAVLGWRRAGVPRTAWVLLLVGLLTAAVVGTMAVGGQLRQELPAVVPPVGQVFECPPGSTPDKPGPVDQARPLHYAQPAMAFDRRAGRLVAVMTVGLHEGRHGETWVFDVCTNSWTQMHPGGGPVSVNLLVYDIDSDVTIAVDRNMGSASAFDLQANSWTQKGVGPTDVTLGAYDPLSGLVVVARNVDPAELWAYDVETDTWTSINLANVPRPGFGGGLAHDASVDRLVVYTGGLGDSNSETWLLDIRTGTWSKSGVQTPRVVGWMTGPTMAYDEAAKRTAAFQRAPLTAYDATADRWAIVPGADSGWPYPGLPYPGLPYPDMMVYGPVNRRLIGMSEGSGTPDIDIPPGGVEALDLLSGEWTLLLEPVEE